VVEILSRCGLSDFELLINSVGCPDCRPRYLAALRERLESVRTQMCEDCQRRIDTNPLRVLDCKVPQDQPIIDSLPSILDYLDEGCKNHFDTVRESLTDRGLAYVVKSRLVRGLDYYRRTTFEITHGALGAQNSIMGGGRYDGLAEAIGSKVAAPGIGFSIGEDRLVMSVEAAHPDLHKHVLDVFIAPLGEAATRHAALLARDLRKRGGSVEVSSDKKLKRALETANKIGAQYALIFGDDELASGTFQWKNMATGEQVALSRDLLLERFGGR